MLVGIVPAVNCVHSAAVHTAKLGVAFVKSERKKFACTDFVPVRPAKGTEVINRIFALFGFQKFFFEFCVAFGVTEKSVKFFPYHKITTKIK